MSKDPAGESVKKPLSGYLSDGRFVRVMDTAIEAARQEPAWKRPRKYRLDSIANLTSHARWAKKRSNERIQSADLPG